MRIYVDSDETEQFFNELQILVGDLNTADGWRVSPSAVYTIDQQTRNAWVKYSIQGVGKRMPLKIIWRGAIYLTEYYVSFADPSVSLSQTNQP